MSEPACAVPSPTNSSVQAQPSKLPGSQPTALANASDGLAREGFVI